MLRTGHSARAFLVLVLLASLQAFAAPAKKAAPKKALAEQIEAILSQPQLARAHWGIAVVELDSGKELYSLHQDQLFLPASNAKLFTTAASLAIAGPNYHFRTTVEATGKTDHDGRLDGDLVIMGRGDPNISGRVVPYLLKTERLPPHTQVLEELADQVAHSGLKIVSGDIVGDDTFYSPQRYAEGWAHDDLQWIDGAPVSALTFNDNVVFVNIQPGEHAGDKAVVTFEPNTHYYELDNRILTAPLGVVRKIGIHREMGSKTIVLWGSLPVGDAGAKEALAIEDPAEFVAQLFRSMLEQRGITVTGKARAWHSDIAQFFDQPAPQTAPPGGTESPATASGEQHPSLKDVLQVPTPGIRAEHISLPFIEDVRVINKTSQNLHAELALRLIGRLAGSGGSLEGGGAVLRQFLLQAGLKDDEFVFFDGSGLSRRDLVTPAAVVRLLLYAARQPWGAAFEDTLPVSGVDGSLSERFLNTPAAGLIHAKTGTLSHVNALSGYGQTRSGKRFVFSILCNNHKLTSGKVLAAMDSIVQLLVSQGGPVKR
jgi:D-alanyl-D-alanine carboxypeptidase/D-alanyl-D-alanine-endopeptidase (penicillin-binding protein 4)